MWYLIDIYIQEFNHLSQYSQGSSECCKSVTIQATGAAAKQWPPYIGIYVATGEKHQGKELYRNSLNNYLYRYSDGTWRTSSRIGVSGVIKSVETDAVCPASIRQWQYRPSYIYDTPWQSGDITVQCS